VTLARFLAADGAVIHVRLTSVRGSSPRDADAQMFVSADACYGTIGGGQLEYMAIDKARTMLRAGRAAETMDLPLGPEIGQCCGGRVGLSLTEMSGIDRASARDVEILEIARRPHVCILGAGHVGRAHAPDTDLAGLTCPIGATASTDKRPEVLAAFVAAEVMTRLTVPAHHPTKLAN